MSASPLSSLEVIALPQRDGVNVIVGQSHFVKTVEDLHEAIVAAGSAIRFGIGFCEASGPRLVRFSGNDPQLSDFAAADARAVGAGHTFVVLLRDGFPVNVLNPVKAIPEVCTVFCATANPVQVLVAVTDLGRGVVGVVDGSPPLGIESAADRAERHALLRTIGYKL